MSLLIPGYSKYAEQELTRQAAIHRVDRLPYSSSFAATQIHVITSQVQAEAWASQLSSLPVSMLGIDTEFTFDGPEIDLGNGRYFVDPTTIRPLVCTVAAYCGSQGKREQSSPLIRLLFDLRRREVRPALQEILRSHVPWVAHSAKAELHCLWACDIEPEEHLLIDTHITACCLNLGRFHRPKRNNDSSAADARDSEAKSAHITSLVGQCAHYGFHHPFEHVKEEMRNRFRALADTHPFDPAMADYAMSDAEYALRLHFAQQADVDRFGLGPHLGQIEWPLVPVMARIESNGLPVDVGRLQHYRTLCQSLAQQMAKRLAPFNITAGSRNSFLRAMSTARLLNHFLCDGKPSTQQDTLRKCENLDIHPAIKPFRLHRYFQRLADDKLLSGQLTCTDGRLHCDLNQLRSVTGRIASSSPNLIGLDGRLRPLVAVSPGMTLVELDYAQIEVGLAGAEWRDENLVRLFNQEDAYAAIAQSFYEHELTPEERAMSSRDFKGARPKLRDKVKTLVLGVLYGRGAASIATRFGCSVEHAETELQRFFNHFSEARDNAALAVRASLARGYGVSTTGLRRFIESGNSRMQNAMRNFPIQSVAAAIFKNALRRVDGYLRGTPVQILLPRHDSILLLVPAAIEKTVIDAVTTIMIGAVRDIYPQLQPRVDAKSGCHWPTPLTLDAYHQKEFAHADHDTSRT